MWCIDKHTIERFEKKASAMFPPNGVVLGTRSLVWSKPGIINTIYDVLREMF